LLRHVFVAEDRKLTALLNDTETKLVEAGAMERAVAEDLERQEEAARTATHEARHTEDDLASARAAAAEAVLRRDRQSRELAYQHEQVVALDQRKSEVSAEVEALAARLALVEAECKRLQEDDARLRVEAEASVESLRSAEESYAEKLSTAATAEAEIENARAELLKHTAVAERLREIARQLEGTLERLGVQAEGLAREGERAAAQYAERKAEADSFSTQSDAAREHIATLNAERERAVDAVVQGHEAVSDTEAELTRVRDEYSRTKHRLESLKELDDRRAYYSSAVQMMFAKESAPRDFHFIGTLADALNVDAKWERAVEGVFGSSLQSIVVPTPDDAARAAQWLRENNGGRASFMVAGLHGGSDETTYQANALTCDVTERPALSISFATEAIAPDLKIADLLGAPRELLSVLNRTLPEKMNARLAANLDEAMAKSLATGEVFVTLNGDWVASGQFVSAGDARAVEEGAGLLTFKRELRELEARAEVLSVQAQAAEGMALSARTNLVTLEDAVVILNEAIGREEREAMARELTATGLAHEIERAERHMRVVADDACARRAGARGKWSDVDPRRLLMLRNRKQLGLRPPPR
jgi:chromosome segregation protein